MKKLFLTFVLFYFPMANIFATGANNANAIISNLMLAGDIVTSSSDEDNDDINKKMEIATDRRKPDLVRKLLNILEKKNKKTRRKK